jgi:hypothetical protein
MTTPLKFTTPPPRFLGVLLGLTAASGLIGCGGSGSHGAAGTGGGAGGGAGSGTGGTGGSPPSGQTVGPADYTVSYRTAVRVPGDGVVMAAQAFVDQVSLLDPIAALRCPVSNAAAFETTADALGGITWTHPVTILKDQSLPPLYKGRVPPQRIAVPGVDSAGVSDSGAPTIVRPDLVGYQQNTAIFLSQRHGLLAVKTDGPAPVLSCALKLPGQAKYFFYQGDELVLLVNGLSVNEAGLLRFRVTPKGFDFVDAVMLDQQSIQDARLFDSTLVVYTRLLTPVMTAGTPSVVNGPAVISGGAASGSSTGAGTGAGAAAPVAVPRSDLGGSTTGVAVTAVKWNTALTVAWHEEFLNDPVTQPFDGQDPVVAAKTLARGDVISTTRTFKPFISASDRYVVVSRDVSRTVFTGTTTQTYSYCAASHEGPAHTVQYCSPRYEQRPNPDYRPPQPNKGDYDCNGKTLLDCIQEAAPTVSQYIYVRVGQTCSTSTYHDWICDQYKTESVTYPTYASQSSTEFVVYRYDAGDFVKLDQQLYELVNPGTTTGSVASLTFAGKPLEVAGAIDSKNDLQFQHGHFYVLTNQGQQLHTLLLVGNSIAKLGTQAEPRQRTSLSSYSGAHSTLFADDRMMVSRGYYDAANPMNIPSWSDVIMLDLAQPDFPRPVNQFVMPGSSDQLILAHDGVLGPGTVAFTSGGVSRNLQKLTLFNRVDASEIGNLLLGTEFNAAFAMSWLGTSDDQRIRLDPDSQRLFLPYGGYLHAPASSFNPQAHRLNITAVANQLLTPEMTFDVVEDIVRTVSTSSAPGAGKALAFGDSSVYSLAQLPDTWSLNVIEEFATPVAVYRFGDDADLHARIDRIGARCLLSTFQGSLAAFKPDRLAVGPPLACPEGSLPTAVGLAVVFAGSSTGWQLSSDGTLITPLDPAAVTERLTHVRNDVYCALDPDVTDGAPVPYLDAVPPAVTCFPYPVPVTGGGAGGASGAVPTAVPGPFRN